MSVVVAVFDPRTHQGAMAGDRQAQAGGQRLLSAPKVHRLGRILIGLTGLSMARVYWHAQEPPAEHDDVLSWARAHQQGYRAWLTERGHGEVRDGLWGCDLHGLILAREGIFVLDSCGHADLVEPAPDVDLHGWAAGSGDLPALGALHVLARACPWRPSELPSVASRAVAAACAHVVTCGGAMDALTLNP